MLFALLSTINCPLSTLSQGSAFTYQGRLNDGGSPAGGIYDLRFTIYDSLASGTGVAGPLTNSATGVTNGLFTVTLDFVGHLHRPGTLAEDRRPHQRQRRRLFHALPAPIARRDALRHHGGGSDRTDQWRCHCRVQSPTRNWRPAQ